MGKPTICIGESKGGDQLRGNSEADQRLWFRYTDSTLYFLNTKFHASSCFLLLHRSVYVGPVRKPHCWFSHEVAQMFSSQNDLLVMIVIILLLMHDNPGSLCHFVDAAFD